MLFAEMATGPPSTFPIFATIAGAIGIIGPAIIGIIVQFKLATSKVNQDQLKANQDQLHLTVQGCEERANRVEAELRAEIRSLQDRILEAEKWKSVWQTRYEILIAKSREFPSLPPKSAPE